MANVQITDPAGRIHDVLMGKRGLNFKLSVKLKSADICFQKRIICGRPAEQQKMIM